MADWLKANWHDRVTAVASDLRRSQEHPASVCRDRDVAAMECYLGWLRQKERLAADGAEVA